MKTNNVAIICKLMPYYRLGIFQKLSSLSGNLLFVFFGDTQEQGGIKQIPFSYANEPLGKRIRWVKTKNYFYKPERLLWQTGIIKEIFRTNYKVFIFEGAIAHYPIWLFAILCKFSNKKVLFWTHGNRGLDRGIKKILRIILFRILGDALLLYGQNQRNIMIKDGYNPNKLFVIYNSLQAEEQFKTLAGIDLSQVAELKSQLFKFPKRFTMIFIGRLVRSKRVMDILNVIQNLNSLKIYTNCIFIGDGSEKESMIEKCDDFEIKGQVYFTGPLYSENQISKYFAMSDIMISPGNVGLNCLHSMAYGVPVITHDDFKFQGPEVEAIVKNCTGTFFDYYDLNSLTNVLKIWIENQPPKEEIKKNCQEMIKNTYSPENQSICIKNAIEKVLQDA
tara:strand:+ start:8645 stop:9817 length:1173 start_codon:yes stop_codon:yes gene_type:complete